MTRTISPATYVWSNRQGRDLRRERHQARRLEQMIRMEVAVRRIELLR